ncbi:MAG: TldD/PmbA family protein [Promethearchaeota archaeon]
MGLYELLDVFDDKLINWIEKNTKNLVDYWDIRAEIKSGNSLEFTNRKSKEISSYELVECSIRALYEGKWGFYVLKDLNSNTIKQGMESAIKFCKVPSISINNPFKINEVDSYNKKIRIKSKKKIIDVPIEEKINLLKEHEDIAFNYSKKVKNTKTTYIDKHVKKIFLNAFGSKIFQEMEFVRLFSTVFAAENGVIQHSMNSVAGIGGFEIVETKKARAISKKSAKEAIELLGASSPVGGKFTVIMDPKLVGTFVHEAIGHSCEADLVLQKESVLKGKIGEKIANESVTISDNPILGQGTLFSLPYELYGSYVYDDEGIKSKKVDIIKEGILINFLHNLETASRMGTSPNGHGRASTAGSIPQVRMGFTYLEPQDWELEEIISETKHGILCEDFQYGYTDTTTGNFQFKCRISSLIENGEKTKLMRDVSLGGMSLEILNRISAIGNKKTFNYSDGICGKGGQGVRVCSGGPFIRVEDVIIGGLN